MSEHFIMIHVKLEIEINDKVMSESMQQLWLQNLYFISRNIKIIYKLEEKTNNNRNLNHVFGLSHPDTSTKQTSVNKCCRRLLPLMTAVTCWAGHVIMN